MDQEGMKNPLFPPMYAVLIDLSGTLFIDEVAIPGAIDAVRRLVRHGGFAVRFVTNTTKESTSSLLSRLHRLGFDYVEKEQVFTSISAATRLVKFKRLRPLLLLEPEAATEFEGISTDDPNAVVVGLSPSSFNYGRLNEAFRLLMEKPETELIGIHKARYFARADGFALGPGPFVTALEYATGKTATVVGKPDVDFFRGAVYSIRTPIAVENTVMIGDDVMDDVVGAVEADFRAILVKTGKYREGDEEEIQGDADLFPSIVEAIDKILINDGKDYFGE